MSQQKVVAFDETLANEQQAFLTAAYNRFENLYEAIEHFALASFRGYSHVQIQENRFELLDQWNIARDGRYGAWYWNPEAKSMFAASLGEANRLDLVRDRILVRTHPRPIDEIALIKWLRQNLSQKDWDSFIEIYGIPGCVIIMPSNIPSGQETAYKSSAEDVSEGASGALPNGSDVKFSDSPRGVTPFKDHLNYLSEKLVLAGTGGLLTMLSAPGSGTLAGSAHMEAFEMIARAEARKISEVFQKQLDKTLLAAAFPGKPILAYFDIAANEETDVTEIIDHAVKLSQAGYKMDSAQLAEKTGYTLSAAPVAPPQEAGFSGQGSEIQNRQRDTISIHNNFDPSQPRDEDGQWTATGGGAPVDSIEEGQRRNAEISKWATAKGETQAKVLSKISRKVFRKGLSIEQAAAEVYAQREKEQRKAVGDDVYEQFKKTKIKNSALLTNAIPAIADALSNDLQPVRERLAIIMQVEDPELRNSALTKLQTDLPAILKKQATAPECAKAIEDTLAAAMANGMQQTARPTAPAKGAA
jgi:hypothetical protein